MITYEAQQILTEVQEVKHRLANIEATGYNNATTLDTVATNTAPVISWGAALLIGIIGNVAVFPLVKQAQVPYIATGLTKFEEIQAIIAQEIGITYANVKDFATTGEGQGVHPQLMQVYRRANELAQEQGFTITIRDGLRTVAEQAEYLRKGATKTMNSRHIKAENGWGHALDLEVLYSGEKTNAKDWEGVNKIKPLMFQAAKELNIPLEWGGDWSGFKDGFHWQLPWADYPATKAFSKPRTDQTPVLTERTISALLTEIKRTESSGGDYQVVSKGNCMLGAYQAAAITLVQHGYIRHDKFTAAGKPIKGQPHCDFLANANNWTLRGGQTTFLNSTAIQDEFARKNISHNLTRGAQQGAIDPNSSQQTLAGYSKAAWLKPESAIGYYRSGEDDTDGNGKAISTYANDGERIAANIATGTGTGNLYTLFTRIQEVLWKQPTPSPST